MRWVHKKKRTKDKTLQSPGTGLEAEDAAGTGLQDENDLKDDDEFEDDSDEEEQNYEPDKWMISGDTLIRVHNQPRTRLSTRS